jgi:GNAT superfamily N-acetyltransferase
LGTGPTAYRHCMTTQEASGVTPTTDEDGAIATLTIAFSSDPVARWFLPDAGGYLTYWPPFVRAFAGSALTSGTADSIADCGGVALWLPPDVEPDNKAMAAIAAEVVPESDHEEVFGVLGQMGDYHPAERHWYLPVMGVDVAKQSVGLGSALLRHAAERCDRDGLPAYLEATNPRNKRLYAAHGFEELGVIQVGGSPPIWPMLRKPH